MFLANKLNKGAGSPAAPVDAQFNYVTMLLHGDGTNGAQNNTFLDSSTNEFSITRNGNTTQGSFSPYGFNWSNNLISSATTYFVTPSSSSLALGTGDFTVEAWVNYSSLIGGGRGIFQFSANTSIPLNTNSLALGASSNGAIGWNLYANNSDINSGVPVAVGTWYHVAVVRSSGTTKLYVNGTSVISVADSKDYTQTYLIIGGFYSTTFLMDGYISNFRVVKDTAVYTSSFTPSTTPLTAITNTSLLTCQSNRFVDNSTNNFTLTLNGTPSVQRFNPFGASTAYSTSVIGGSGYFDGSGDYLNATSASLSGQFTIEYWYYSTTSSTNYGVTFGDSSTSTGIELYQSGTTFYLYSNNGFRITGGTVNPNSWNHVALTRDGSNVMRLYVNGVVSGTTYTSSANFSTTMRLGAEFYSGSISGYLTGYVCDFRMLSATSTPTIPTAPLTAISGTTMLLNFTNGAIFDNAMMNDLETVGNAQISTSVVKYGTGSLYFDGTGDYLNGQVSPNLSFGTGDFTIEGWGYVTSTSTTFQCMLSIGAPVQIYARSGTIKIYFNDTDDNITYIVNGAEGPTSSISANTWFHFAVVRNGTTFTAYVDGVAGTPTTGISNEVALSAYPIALGIYTPTSSFPFTGYIDDFRITKGYARYTANFTAPTSALSDTGPY